MSENEWIEKQKQHLSQNCIIQGQFDCWLCSLGGKDRQYSTLLNGRSLIDSLWYIQKDRISVQYPECLERNHTELYRYRKHMYKVYVGRSSSVDVYYSYCITFRKKYSLRFSISHVMGFIPTKLSQISDLVNLGSCCMCLTMKCWRRFSKLLL